MGRKLAVNVAVLDADRNPVVLEAGAEVPDWAAGQLGEHCFEQAAEQKQASKPRSRSTK
jgi:hypothetical protein